MEPEAIMAAESEISDFERFCGGPFWDVALSWNTTQPDFTPCFLNTAVVWTPCAFLWLALLPYAIHLRGVKGKAVPPNKLNTGKTALGIILGLIPIVQFFYAINEFIQGTGSAVMVTSPVILAATIVVATTLIQVERVKGFITSGILFIFWLLTLVVNILPLYSYILNAILQGSIEDVFSFTVFVIYFVLVLVQLVLSCIADTSPELRHKQTLSKKPSPELTSSFLSRITFSWINSLVFTGYRKSLEEEDVWDLHPRDVAKYNGPILEDAWNNEMMKCRWTDKKPPTYSKSERSMSITRSFKELDGGNIEIEVNYNDESTPLMGKGSQAAEQSEFYTDSEGKKKYPSLFSVLTKVYGVDLIEAQLCKLVYDCLVFAGPVLQGYLIEYTETIGMADWKGYMYATAFFVTGILQSLFFHQLFHIGMTCGMRMKSAIITVVYKKALTMSNESRKSVTVGEIVNLMSVDAQRVQDVAGYIWMIWSSPFQIAIAVWMLWGIVGPSVLAGLAVMLLLIPINGVMATFQRKLQIRQMTQKDQRIKLMNEILNGIRVLKLYAWELSFKDKVNAIRNIELETLKTYSYLSAFGTFTWTCAPFIVILATFATYVASGNVLDANTAFVSLSLFNILRFPINLLPMMISYIVTASVSVKRINKFLAQGDIDFTAVSHDRSKVDPITVVDGTFSWGLGDDDLTTLRDVNIKVKDGSLVAIVGSVGSGKSSIISALLGEMEKTTGTVNVCGRIAYVAQQAWIQNATLRENILFGKRYVKSKYDRIIDECALKPDLAILPGGDMTEIGEKGINLSGGQKQRISLARAVYSDADIFLLDDPLSAVDSHVGKHIFEKVVSSKTGVLRNKTRILVTHGLHWLPHVDDVLVVDNGHISEQGTYDELLQHNGPFAALAQQYLIQDIEDAGSETEIDSEIEQTKSILLQRLESVQGEDEKKEFHRRLSQAGLQSSGSSDGEETITKSRRFSRSLSRGSRGPLSRRNSRISVSRQASRDEKSQLSIPRKSQAEIKPAPHGQKLIEQETSESGEVQWNVYFAYAKALGLLNALAIAVFFLLFQVCSVGSNLWLTAWTDNDILKNASLVDTDEYTTTQNLYLGIYGGLGGFQALFVLLYAIVTAYSMVYAARELHEGMLANILRSPTSFFDTTPTGRILNRFSRDVETVDNTLPQLFRSWFNTAFTVASTIFVISFSTPLFLSVVLPLGLLYYFIQRFYIPTSRQLKRVESTTRSPIYTHFSETITGSSTIRAYGHQARFVDKSDALVDHNLVFYFASIASNRWLGVRLEFLGACTVLCAALFAVLGKDVLSGSLVGLSISYALQVTQSLNWMVRMTSDLESNVVSVERMKEYSETKRENLWYIEATAPAASWPQSGNLAFEDYSTRYRDGLDLVLKGITLNITAGEKVGIVGRTGAGKSSLTLALFRLIEGARGSIIIDGLRVENLGLHQLRSRLTILPQDPVIFSGTLRMNLDPFDKFSDVQVWSALENAYLKDFVETLPAGIDYECGEGGVNLSVGQRQLVCLARTLLRKTKILILDEATAAVDLETDELIQQTIRNKFKDCTVLTIAHRLNTIMDYDRVLVLDEGRIKEFDNPKTLLANPDSQFYSMAKDAGLV